MNPAALDFYTTIHKAIRRGLFDVTAAAGSLDWSDPDATAAFAVQLSELCALLDEHARREDDLVHPLLQKFLPDEHALMEEQHQELEPRTCALLGQLSEVRAEAAAGRRCELGLAFYRDIARFVGEYLQHMADEEERVLPAVRKGVPAVELAALAEAFRESLSPAEVVRRARVVLPAVSPCERPGVLALLRSAVPPAVLPDLEQAAAQAIGTVAWRRLSDAG